MVLLALWRGATQAAGEAAAARQPRRAGARELCSVAFWGWVLLTVLAVYGLSTLSS